jgi:hypothetical protein
MCYGDPDKLLALFLEAQPLTPNSRGHTPLDDFEHFCAYTGCTVETAGKEGFAWVKLAYITAKTPVPS